ncbi:MAG: carboxymuconolactone decarboxylase family protein [Burkholderiales bacterium]|nr:carboxymuconolactone decarboxylase family protein [Nitrosomonas sp.]MCP5273966.1 carboxymuconolactone decarboxylase family protein [Burkholderiales bacterium]
MRTISQIIDDAPVTPEIETTFNKIKTALNAPFTPHFFRVWATAPESLNGIWPVMNHILTSGRVSRRLKEMIFVAISSLKDCHYCEAAHHAFCLNIGVSQTQIEKLITTHSIDEEEIMEIIAMSGMAVFYNHLANATKINIDKGFTQILTRHAEK